MTLLAAVAAGGLSGAAAIALRRAGAAGWLAAALGLLATLLLALAIPPGPPAASGPGAASAPTLVLAGETLGEFGSARDWLAPTAAAGLGLSVVGAAAGASPAIGGALLLAISLGALGLAAGDPSVALLLASAAGLGSLPLLGGRAGRRELAALAGTTAALVVAAAWLAATLPAVPAPLAPSGGAPLDAGIDVVPGGWLAVLVPPGALGVRLGLLPWQRRLAASAERAGLLAAPVALAAATAVLVVVASGLGGSLLAADDGLGPERALAASFAAATFLLAPLAAWVQDDARHLLAYVVAAGAGMLVLGTLTPGPGAAPAAATLDAVRVLALAWTLAALALGAVLATLEAAFATVRTTELDGWARRMPLAAIALGATALGLAGLPGWSAWSARSTLAAGAAGAPLAGLVVLAGVLPALPLGRLLVVGLRRPGPRVRDGASERPSRPEPVELGWRPRPIPPRDPVERFAEARSRLRAELARAAGVAAALWRSNRAPAASAATLAVALLALAASLGAIGPTLAP